MKLKKIIMKTAILMTALLIGACSFTPTLRSGSSTTSKNFTNKPQDKIMSSNLDTAVFGAGCFWCVEAIFQELNGVQSVESGYSNGTTDKQPTYKQVCTGETGYAEVAKIIFDPSVISYEEILEVFWTTHDPTTLNKQGGDVGTQYRSAIFYTNDNQKQTAEKSKKEIAPQIWDNPIVTEITPLSNYYKAEDYHQDYYNNNENQGYCQYVISPKLEKFRKKFKEKLKKN